jgi:hypothetical protein
VSFPPMVLRQPAPMPSQATEVAFTPSIFMKIPAPNDQIEFGCGQLSEFVVISRHQTLLMNRARPFAPVRCWKNGTIEAVRCYLGDRHGSFLMPSLRHGLRNEKGPLPTAHHCLPYRRTRSRGPVLPYVEHRMRAGLRLGPTETGVATRNDVVAN